MWIILQPEDLRARLSDTERVAISRAAGDVDDTVCQQVLNDITATVRGYIAAARKAVMGSVGIPPSLKGPALDIAVPAYYARACGALHDPRGVRVAARDAAIALLRDVAAGKFYVEDPGEPGAVPSSARPGPAIDEPPTLL